MKRFLVAGALGMLVLAPGGTVPSSHFDALRPLLPGSNAQAKEPCSDKTLKGKWSVAYEGSLLGAIIGTTFTPGAVSVVALLDSDGAGSFTGAGTANVNGTAGTQSGVGTYTVNPDCTGTGTFDYGTWSLDLFFVISGEGVAKEVRFINTSQPAVIRGTARPL